MSREAQRRVGGFLEAVPIPMLAVDAQARTIGANAAAVAVFGANLLDRPFVTVLRHPGVVQAVDWVIAPDLHAAPASDPDLPPPAEGGVALRAQFSADGRRILAEVAVSPLPALIGRGALVAILDRSVTEEAEQMRRDFVANVSHELKTPLTALLGFIETLRGPAREDAKARARFLDIMEREAMRMNRLISELLSLSRVQSEERRRPSEPVDLAALLRSVLATMAPAAAAAGVAVTTEGLERPVVLPGDADQLTQVFQNLVENALKYGRSGGFLRLAMTEIAHEPQLRGPAWAVAVEDRGDGIDEIHLPRLTERFYRVDAHRSREEGGTGLGLAIVKHIISRHRGRLRIESRRGEGTRFTVVLPQGLDRG